MTFPEHFSLTLTRVYSTDDYLEFCKGENETPSKESFFSFIKYDFAEDFHFAALAVGSHGLCSDDLDPLD